MKKMKKKQFYLLTNLKTSLKQIKTLVKFEIVVHRVKNFFCLVAQRNNKICYPAID